MDMVEFLKGLFFFFYNHSRKYNVLFADEKSA